MDMSVGNPADLIAETPFPSAQTMQEPYDFYRVLRAGPPVRLSTGEYAVARRDDIIEITRRPEVFSNHHSVFDDGWMRAATLEDHRNPDYAWGLTVADQPTHTWKRRLAFEIFKPGPLRRQEPVVQKIVDDLIDRFAARGECEFVSEFTLPLTASVILTLFGLPLDHLERAMAWSRYEGFGTRWAAPENQQAARDAIVDCGAFIRERVEERVDDPGDDEISRYLQLYVDERGGLDLANMVPDATSLFIGGIITTNHLISSLMMLFLRNPDQLEKARADRQALRMAIEEGLRVESPVQMIPRLAVEDAEVGGVMIPAGSIVLLLYGAANRDETAFEAADVFNVGRENARQHVAFGNGIHFCIGAPLARLEATVTFERLFGRLGTVRAAEGKNDFANDWTAIFRGPRELHIEFDPVP